MNDVRNMEELGLIQQEYSEEQRKVNFLWESNTAVPPLEPLKDYSQAESNRANLLPREKVCVLVAGRAKVFVRIQQDTEGEYLED